jgi:hypothetical protein
MKVIIKLILIDLVVQDTTIGSRGTIVLDNIFSEYNSNYIHRYIKPTNIDCNQQIIFVSEAMSNRRSR